MLQGVRVVDATYPFGKASVPTSYSALQGTLATKRASKKHLLCKEFGGARVVFYRGAGAQKWLFNFWLLTNIIQIIMKLPLAPFLLNIF
jgi:hypothetical protein